MGFITNNGNTIGNGGGTQSVDGKKPDALGNIQLNAYSPTNPPPFQFVESWGDIGGYALLRLIQSAGSAARPPGELISGGSLATTSFSSAGYAAGPSPAGDWRLCGYIAAGVTEAVCLFQRVK